MIEYQTIRRITVYAVGMKEEDLLKEFVKLGSNGYTVTECRGKGKHGVVRDPFNSSHTHVRIEVLVQPPVADKIMAHLETQYGHSHSLTACMETVEVSKTQSF